MDEELTNDDKRTILTKLFDTIVYEGDSVSVKYRFLARSIANRSLKTKKISQEEEMVNQTIKNDPDNGGHSGEEIQNSLLFPIWQEYMDEDRTSYSVTENAISGETDADS